MSECGGCEAIQALDGVWAALITHGHLPDGRVVGDVVRAALAESERRGEALRRIGEAMTYKCHPTGKGLEHLVRAVNAALVWRDESHLIAKIDVLTQDNAALERERDALAADNARLVAELADRVDGDGERVAERERLEAERERLLADSQALGRIKAATEATGWPTGETLDDLVAAVAAVSAGRDALAADHARLAAERDQARADNARLLADSQALAAVGRILVSAGRGPVSDIVHIVQGVADVLDELVQTKGPLARISAALTATGRDADSCGHGGPGDVADAVEEALLDLSARWRGRDEALERIREALGMPPANPAMVADGVEKRLAWCKAESDAWRGKHWSLLSDVWLAMHPNATNAPNILNTAQLLDAVRTEGRRHDVLPAAPATGGDCGGAA